jgi:Exostosin family
VIPESEISKFSILKDKFGVSFSSNDRGAIDITNQCLVSHSNPLTSVGNLSRPLIFPSTITKYCRSIWANHRRFHYSFQGLVTNKREIVIGGWLRKNISQQCKLPNPNSRFNRFRKKILPQVGLDYTIKKKIGDFLFWSSDRGRKFPIKAWDEEYFKVLSNSQYVLCPSGDYTWSYRFFESILCGAIPIVEKECEAYEGFKFFFFEDDARTLKWSLEDAEYNYELCVEKLTVPKVALNEEIKKLIRIAE